jgi:thiamine-phosphate pyrophosphorylase
VAGENDSALRIIDANLNRTGEGLRVIEDIARLVLNDRTLSAELKTVRHELVHTGPGFQRQLVRSRDAAGDVGRDLQVPGRGIEASGPDLEGSGKGAAGGGDTGPRDLHSVLVANSRRVQEALRVLEEMAKLPGISEALSSERFKQARFRLYTIEKEMLGLLFREDNAGK